MRRATKKRVVNFPWQRITKETHPVERAYIKSLTLGLGRCRTIDAMIVSLAQWLEAIQRIEQRRAIGEVINVSPEGDIVIPEPTRLIMPNEDTRH